MGGAAGEARLAGGPAAAPLTNNADTRDLTGLMGCRPPGDPQNELFAAFLKMFGVDAQSFGDRGSRAS